MKTKKMISLMLAGITSLSLTACGGDSAETSSGKQLSEVASVNEILTTEVASGEAEGYTYGAGETFHSEEPVSYSMMFSDHENYPYQADWRLLSAIEERTNVTFDLTLIARSDYEDKKSVLINSGDAPYIIPKTYEEGKYVNGGQVIAISDWVKYMPNYQKCVEEWGMIDDIKAKLQSDGKYYVLPGMWEAASGGYSYMIRKDIFEAAGIDVEEVEKTWTYEDFYEALKIVKDYTGAEYVWSDGSKGDSSLKIAGPAYGVRAGWDIANGLVFDHENLEFKFANTSDNFKEYLTYFNKLITEGLLDPESFSQEDDAAKAKFFTGQTYVMNGNYQNLADYSTQMQVDGAKLYMVVQPGGPEGLLQIENSRLENGIMISKNALDELGEEEFIKMLRFIDWLWYSEEGQMLSLWGVEGETYAREGETIILNEDIAFNGMNPTATKQLNTDYGFAGGVFAYGGSSWLRTSKFTEGEKSFNDRIQEYRTQRPIDPPFMPNEEEMEELNLIQTPLVDCMKIWTQKFIIGQADIETQWDDYVAECESLGATRFVNKVNEIFEKNKTKLGYE